MGRDPSGARTCRQRRRQRRGSERVDIAGERSSGRAILGPIQFRCSPIQFRGRFERFEPTLFSFCSQTPAAPDGSAPAWRPDGAKTYSQLVGALFVAYIDAYTALHSGHDVAASTLDAAARLAKGKQVQALIVDMNRKFIQLVGTRRKCSYTHHLTYSVVPLYVTFGKAWCAAMEGNEALHKELKIFFQRLVVHSGHGSVNDMAQVLNLHIASKQLREEKGHRLPVSDYAASCLNRVGVSKSFRMEGGGKKRHVVSETVVLKGERSQKKYKPEDKKMQSTRVDLVAAGAM